jgi:hypothetical protein
MILEYFTLKTEWLEMEYGKCLYQHSFLDKWIAAKRDMQAKSQVVQCNSFHVAQKYVCQNKSCKSSRHFVLFLHISIQSFKGKTFRGKSQEECSFNNTIDCLEIKMYLHSESKYLLYVIFIDSGSAGVSTCN